MKTVRVQNNLVVEVIPEYGLPVEKWYGEKFAKECIETDNDEVVSGWGYDGSVFLRPEEIYKIDPEKYRQEAYEFEQLVEWNNEKLTVDQANEKYMRYFIESKDKAEELQQLIIQAKKYIRECYPDNE